MHYYSLLSLNQLSNDHFDVQQIGNLGELGCVSDKTSGFGHHDDVGTGNPQALGCGSDETSGFGQHNDVSTGNHGVLGIGVHWLTQSLTIVGMIGCMGERRSRRNDF